MSMLKRFRIIIEINEDYSERIYFLCDYLSKLWLINEHGIIVYHVVMFLFISVQLCVT